MSVISILVVNYSNEDEVYQYAKNLSIQSRIKDISLIITLNKFNDESSLNNLLNTLDINFYIVKPNQNLGYLKGCLYGYQEINKKYHLNSRWLIISNTDIKIHDHNFYEKLLINKYDNDIYCIAPSIYSIKYKYFQNPLYIKRVSLNKLRRVLFIHEFPFIAFIYEKISHFKSRLLNSKERASQFIYSSHGSFFIINQELYNYFSHEPFLPLMYSEESYIAENVRIMNKKAFFDESLKVFHDDNSTTQFLKSKQKSKFIRQSLIFIIKRFYSK
jgi:hypothetical protein